MGLTLGLTRMLQEVSLFSLASRWRMSSCARSMFTVQVLEAATVNLSSYMAAVVSTADWCCKVRRERHDVLLQV
jgi:hypothetical protein